MKRLFILVSTVLVAIYLGISLAGQVSLVEFGSYKAVDVIGKDTNRQTANRDQVTEVLTDLADEHKSVIARRIVEPNASGETSFTYAIYGSGQAPEGLTISSKESAETSDLVSSYLIVSGDLDNQVLKESLESLGYSGMVHHGYSLFSIFLSTVVSEVAILSFFVFLLTFMALTLIYRIKTLRFAGIRLISGQGFLQVVAQPLWEDVRQIVMATLVGAIIGLLILYLQAGFLLSILQVFFLGLFLYALALASISVLLSLVYLLGLRHNSLVDLLKGKLPLKRMLAMMMVGQLLAILVVGFSTGRLLQGYQEIRLLEQAQEEWALRDDYYKSVFSYSSAMMSEEEVAQQNKKWREFAKGQLEAGSALFVKSNVDQYLFGSDVDPEGNRLTDYSPRGNVLYVTPAYLTEQKVAVGTAFLEKMNHLTLGEYGLILPESLRHQAKQVEEMFQAELEGFSRESLEAGSQQLFDTKISLTYTDSGHQRFLYNDGERSQLQYLTDPIIVVLTPKSTGATPISDMFWGTSIDVGMKFKDYQATIEAMKEQGVYNWVSYLVNHRLTFMGVLNTKRTEFYSLLIGTVLTLATAILLFDAMNLLYFEQFRREIFIKRLAGMTFRELHGQYLLGQLGVFLVGLLTSVWLTSNLVMGSLAVGLLAVNAMVILKLQDKKEQTANVAVLKGQ
ncbi:TPA: bacteriocin-associated integral membrane family protein [Streptococcus suis]